MAAAGVDHAVALDTGGKIWNCGYPQGGQRGNP
jgi:alpha-tubulin suppressor-like RCC1 family protein